MIVLSFIIAYFLCYENRNKNKRSTSSDIKLTSLPLAWASQFHSPISSPSPERALSADSDKLRSQVHAAPRKTGNNCSELAGVVVRAYTFI